MHDFFSSFILSFFHNGGIHRSSEKVGHPGVSLPLRLGQGRVTPSEESYLVQENNDKDFRFDDYDTLTFQPDLCDP